MDYGEILKKSWQIIWKFKILWIFGFLASCGQNGGGGGGGGGGTSSIQVPGQSGERLFQDMPGFGNQIVQFFENIPAWQWVMLAGGTLFLILLISLVVLAVSTIGKIGLVRGAWQADEGAAALNFGVLLRESFPYFWRVILLTIGLTILGWVIGFILILPVLFFTIITLGCGLCCLIPFAIVLGWAVSIYVNQVVVAIVGEDLDLMEGLKRGWEVFKENVVTLALMGFILFIARTIISFVLFIPVIIMMVPLMIGVMGAVAADSGSGMFAASAVTIAMLCLYVPILIALMSVIEAYVGTAWTLVFRRLTGRQGVALEDVKLPEVIDIPPAAGEGD